MNEIILIEDFWKECDDANFSKEATILFFYLLKIYRERKCDETKMHPNKLSSVVKGFTPANVASATEELAIRGYISYIAPTEACSSGIYKFVKAVAPKRIRNKSAENQSQTKINQANKKP